MPALSRERMVEATAASLRFLDLAKPEITVPLWSMAYLAPLAPIVQPAFTLLLYGRKRAMKTTLAQLTAAHFGDLAGMMPHASWYEPVYRMDVVVRQMPGQLIWIEDYSQPRQSPVLARYLRVLTGTASISAARLLPPKAARRHFFFVSLTAEDFTLPMVEVINQTRKGEAALYPVAMAAYADWITAQAFQSEGSLCHFINSGQSEVGLDFSYQPRLLYVGYWMGLAFAEQAGVINAGERQRRLALGRQILPAINEKQLLEMK
jgi:hypothetical protein